MPCFQLNFFLISPNRVFVVIVIFSSPFSISLVFFMAKENLASQVEFLLTFDLVCVVLIIDLGFDIC